MQWLHHLAPPPAGAATRVGAGGRIKQVTSCSLFFSCYTPGGVCARLTPTPTPGDAPFQRLCLPLPAAAARLPALPGRWSILIAFQRRWLGPLPRSPGKC